MGTAMGSPGALPKAAPAETGGSCLAAFADSEADVRFMRSNSQAAGVLSSLGQFHFRRYGWHWIAH